MLNSMKTRSMAKLFSLSMLALLILLGTSACKQENNEPITPPPASITTPVELTAALTE